MFPRFHEAPFVPGEYRLHMIKKDGRHGIKQHIVYRKDERLPTPSFLPSPRSVGRSVGQSLVWVPWMYGRGTPRAWTGLRSVPDTIDCPRVLSFLPDAATGTNAFRCLKNGAVGGAVAAVSLPGAFVSGPLGPGSWNHGRARAGHKVEARRSISGL